MATYTKTELDTLKSDIDTTLDTLQKAVDTQALGNSLPLLGDSLQSNDAAQFITKLKTTFDSEYDKLIKTDPTATITDGIKQAITTAATKLGVLKYLHETDLPNGIEYVLDIGQDLTSVGSTPLATDIGLPNLGLKVSGNADTKIGYDFKLGFGIDKVNGFFLDTAEDSLKLTLGVTTPNLAADASLGFLQFNAKDAGTNFGGDFTVKLKNTNADKKSSLLFLSDPSTLGADATFTGGANIKLALAAVTGVKGLPSVSTDLAVDWTFNASTSDPKNKANFGKVPTVSFNNITVDAGSAISDFIAPVLKDVQKITDPLQPILGVLSDSLPVVGVSLLQIAGGDASSQDFVKQLKDIKDIIALAKTIPDHPGELKFDLGSYSISGDTRDSTATKTATKTAPVALKAGALAAVDQIPSAAKDFINQLSKKTNDPGPNNDGLDLQFPLLTDGGKTAVDLLLGKDNLSLFSFTPPPLQFRFPRTTLADIPVFGPVVVSVEAGFGASAGITIGYDNKGLKEFQAPSGTASQLLDGFYASRPTNSAGIITGDNLELDAGIYVTAGVSLGVAKVAVGGGITGTVKFDLSTNHTPPAKAIGALADVTDKVRPDDFLSNPLCSFNTTGELDAVIFGQISLDFGFFSFDERLDLADIKLVDFNLNTCDSPDHYKIQDPTPTPDPKLEAQLKGQGIIDRVGTAGDDNIFVTALTDYDSNTGQDLLLKGLDLDPGKTLADSAGKKYEKVKLIVIKGGDGNDLIDLIRVKTPGQLSGGAGNDTIIGGLGNDFLMGGAGNNFLNGGGGSDTVDYSADPAAVYVNLATGKATNGYGGTDTLIDIQNAVGSKYNDTLIAGDANAVLQGGAGDDTLLGGKGDDVLMGGIGKNYLDGGGGTNTVSYLTAPGPIDVNLSSQNVGDSSAVILPTNASPLYLSANSAVGGYGVVDDTIKNIQNLQGSIYDDILVAGNAAPSGTVYKSKNGYTYTGSYIDGYSGNDIIYAGAGIDVLDGGQGINWLSYALSTAGVNVDLTPVSLATKKVFGSSFSTNTGGYAQGDIILAAKNEYTDNNGTDTNFSSFQNLEGSAYNDTLKGDGKDNIIRGGAGNDTIYGGDGNDTLIGGAGADYLSGDGYTGTLRADLDSASIAGGTQGAGNTASYADSPDGVTVNLTTHSGQRSDAEGDQLFGIQNLIGSGRADIFFGGNEFSNDFNPGLSGGGTDIVIGGTGHTNSLTIDYSLGDYGAGAKGGFTGSTRNGSITRLSTDGKTVLDAVSFANIDRLFFTGTIQDDTITGGSNAKGDVIFAGAGNDTVNGGGGNDYLDGGDGIDTLSDYLGDRTASISLTGIDPNDPNAKQIDRPNFVDSSTTIKNFEVFKDITTGSGNDSIIQPGRVNNTFIKAGTGSDYIDPGLGFDTVDGGRGGSGTVRTLHVDYSQGDTGGGMLFNVDRDSQCRRFVSKSFSQFDFDLLDRVGFNNFDRYEVTGTSQDDTIEGGDGNDVLNGGSGGKDTPIGGRGDDILIASSGGSTLKGTNNDDRGKDTLNYSEPGTFGNYTHTYDLAQDVDTLYGGAGADLFILGDTKDTRTTNKASGTVLGGIYYAHNFYTDGNNDNDYANVVNFDPSQGDAIELRQLDGYAPKYSLFSFSPGVEKLFLGYTDKNGAKKSDLMAIITGNFSTLDLNSSAFKYVGDPYTPPPGPN